MERKQQISFSVDEKHLKLIEKDATDQTRSLSAVVSNIVKYYYLQKKKK